MEVSGKLHTPEEETLEPIGCEAGWAPVQSGHGGEDKNLSTLQGRESSFLDHVACNLPTLPSELSRIIIKAELALIFICKCYG
jgi:hypothetical protein